MAEDIPALQQLCYQIVTLKYGLTPEEIQELIKEEKPDNPPGLIIPVESNGVGPPLFIPPHCRVDPRVINAHLNGIEVPTFRRNDREYPLVSKSYGIYYRWWLEAREKNNCWTQRRSEGLLGGLDHWRKGYLSTYFYFDDLLLLNEHYRNSPCGTRHGPGISWHIRETPSTIYATSKAILQLCSYSPTAPLPNFRNLNQVQQGRVYQEIEGVIYWTLLEWTSINLAERKRFTIQALAHGTPEPDLPSLTTHYNGRSNVEYRLPIQTFVIAIVCTYQVVASQRYDEFHSIDKLRQVLLNRCRWRDRSLPRGTPPEKAIGSWEGGVPTILHRIPDDDVIKELFDKYRRPRRQ